MQFNDEALQDVWDVLNRTVVLDALSPLQDALAGKSKYKDPRPPFAIGFDTNALFRVALGHTGTEVIDYLRVKHNGPVVIPGQTLQEVWNNELVGLRPQAKNLSEKLDELLTMSKKNEYELGDTGHAVTSAITALMDEHGKVFDGSAHNPFLNLLDVLTDVGTPAFVPRHEFAKLGHVRHSSKTPPGYQDSSLGDFFVWCDFLYGVRLATEPYNTVVFVTDDRKKDWSRRGIPHPLLSAEVSSLVKKHLFLWTRDDLNEYLKNGWIPQADAEQGSADADRPTGQDVGDVF